MYITPGQGQNNPWNQFLFHENSVHLPIYCTFCPSNDILTIFPIQMHGRPKLTLPLNMSRLSQGHDLYKLCLMLHAKFQNHRPSGSGFLKGFAIYSHGGHFSHVTLTIYINCHCPLLTMLHIKFGFDWPSCFRADDV